MVAKMNNKILYVSDLDGTLLKNDQRLSEFTVKTINSLVEKGMLFSYATARSYITANKVAGSLSSDIPVIVYNGTFVLENGTQRKLISNGFMKTDAEWILNKILDGDVYPIVYSYINGVEKFSYSPNHMTVGQKFFIDSRKGDIRQNPVTVENLSKGEIFYFTCIDTVEKLKPLYDFFKEDFQCLFYVDNYSGEQWLEIMPKNVSKANAVVELKKLLDCEKVVCFGDGVNDISMFGVSDECYAVANSDDELKKISTAVIESNENDGVAKWLLENYTE